jgi:FKBP-type peptidyl-prolyl cis-trans isomerase 2
MIGENDFVLINFVGRVKSSGKIFDLTKKEVADSEGIKSENFKFNPVLVIPSSNYVLKAVAKSLLNKSVGDKYVLEVKAEDAFGKFDPKLVKTFGIGSFRENGVNPAVGDVLMLDNALATVLSVSGGRVLVSFNNPLAGKDLIYEIEIVRTIEDQNEKCAAVFEHYAGKAPQKTEINENKVIFSYNEDIKPYILDAIRSDIEKYVGTGLSVEVARH